MPDHASYPGPLDRSWSELAGSAYTSLIDSQLAREDARKTSFEQRGIGVITTSGTIVTLLFGLAALVTKSDAFVLGTWQKIFLGSALVFFFVAAITGILVNKPMTYEEAAPEGLRRLLEEPYWFGRVGIGSRRATEMKIAMLARARRQNDFKGSVLIIALSAEVAGIFLVAVAVLGVLTGG